MTKKLLAVISVLYLSACSPEIGSKEWCEALKKKKPKGDWTATEAKDFTKHCIFIKQSSFYSSRLNFVYSIKINRP